MIYKLKMSVEDFGETCNLILDAFERGKPTVPTSLAVKLVGHIEAVYREMADEAEIDETFDDESYPNHLM
jgi:hypothetical protein